MQIRWGRSRGFTVLLSLALLVAVGAGAWSLAPPSPYAFESGGRFTALAYSAGCEQRPERIALALERANVDYIARTSLGSWLTPTQAYAAPIDPACNILGWIAKHNLLTTAFKNVIRDCMNNNAGSVCTTKLATYKFHGLGTSSTAATATDTGCTTELTTQYNPDSTRATGSQTTNGNGVYRTIGTNTVDATAAVVEWCLNTAATGTGDLASHVIFSVINLASGDSLQTTWDLTAS